MAEDTHTEDTIHILHLSYDDDDRSALTFLANDVRFHVVADPKDLQKSSDKTLYYEYFDKVCGLRDAEQREYDEANAQKSSSRSSKKSDSPDKDSAIDVTADEDGEDEDQDSLSAENDLRTWLLEPMTKTINSTLR